MNSKRLFAIGVLVTGLSLAGAGGASAQGVQLRPWIGLYAPTNDIGSVQAVEFGKKESTLAYGADLDFGSGPIGFRLGGAFASNSDVPVRGVGCNTLLCDTRATVLTGTGALLFRVPLPVVHPYAVAGAGAKWYNFDFDDSGLDELIDDQAVFTGQLGLGATVSAGGIGLFAEVSDFISGIDFENSGESNTQHDLVFKAGIALGFGAR
jgi:hypothetical protein